MQRVLDILFSFLALLVLAPILTPIIFILRFTGEGEVFFLQERIGKGGKPFKLYKFATMLKNSPNMGTGTLTMKSDPRILPVGSFLRKTKINELPQLLNILFGDMSVIGPRPLTPQTFKAYTGAIQQTVTRVRPGLSGVGSIIFHREEDILEGNAGSMEFYTEVIMPYKGALEEWYVRNQGVLTYFTAIISTILIVLFPNSDVVWRMFRNLPEPPLQLRKALNFPDFKKDDT